MTADGSTSPKSWISLPEPIRRVFNQFPLVTYDSNALPQRAPSATRLRPSLYIHQPVDAVKTVSSNPACLKWQAFLHFKGIEYDTVNSNSHASPSGSLPFLLPANASDDGVVSPVTSGKIPNWVTTQGQKEEPPYLRHDAYMSLISHPIRNAWLYFLYLDEDNFRYVAKPTYIQPASRNEVVRYALGQQLKQAVRAELLKTNVLIDSQTLYQAANQAFEALSILLGEDEYFSRQQKPGLLDASVFSYTYSLSRDDLRWRSTQLADILRDYPSLLEHCSRIGKQYFRG